MDGWVFTGVAARMLGVSAPTVRRWSDEGLLGEITWTKPGKRGRRKISLAGIEAYKQAVAPSGSGE